MKGWKTIVGVIIVGAGHTLGALQVIPDNISQLIVNFGATLAAIGVAHKAERAVVAVEESAEGNKL